MSFFSLMIGALSGAGWYVLPFVVILSVVVGFLSVWLGVITGRSIV